MDSRRTQVSGQRRQHGSQPATDDSPALCPPPPLLSPRLTAAAPACRSAVLRPSLSPLPAAAHMGLAGSHQVTVRVTHRPAPRRVHCARPLGVASSPALSPPAAAAAAQMRPARHNSGRPKSIRAHGEWHRRCGFSPSPAGAAGSPLPAPPRRCRRPTDAPPRQLIGQQASSARRRRRRRGAGTRAARSAGRGAERTTIAGGTGIDATSRGWTGLTAYYVNGGLDTVDRPQRQMAIGTPEEHRIRQRAHSIPSNREGRRRITRKRSQKHRHCHNSKDSSSMCYINAFPTRYIFVSLFLPSQFLAVHSPSEGGGTRYLLTRSFPTCHQLCNYVIMQFRRQQVLLKLLTSKLLQRG